MEKLEKKEIKLKNYEGEELLLSIKEAHRRFNSCFDLSDYWNPDWDFCPLCGATFLDDGYIAHLDPAVDCH